MTSPQPTNSRSASSRGRVASSHGILFSPNSSAAVYALSSLQHSRPAAVSAPSGTASLSMAPSATQTDTSVAPQHSFQSTNNSNVNGLTESFYNNDSIAATSYPPFKDNSNQAEEATGKGDSLPSTRLFGANNGTNTYFSTTATGSDQGALPPPHDHRNRSLGLTVMTYQNNDFVDGGGYAMITPSLSSTSSNSMGTAGAAAAASSSFPFSSTAASMHQNTFADIVQPLQSRPSLPGVTWDPSIHGGVPSYAYSSNQEQPSFPAGSFYAPDQYLPAENNNMLNESTEAAAKQQQQQLEAAMTSRVTPTPKKIKMEDGTAVNIDSAILQQTGNVPTIAADGSEFTYENYNLLATAYSRKKKSLGVLADSFLETYKDFPVNSNIVVDEAARLLGVERRRIYDIVNVLEAVQILCKEKKNTYKWLGIERLPVVFGKLQERALPEYPEDARQFLGWTPSSEPSAAVADESLSAPQSRTGRQSTRSLAKLSQDFLQLYLVGNQTLTLPDASDKILGPPSMQELISLGGGPANRTVSDTVDLDEQKKLRAAASRGLKTKIRRLYDIANIFLSIGLLRKIEAQEGEIDRRPRFTWSYHLTAHEIYQLHQRSQQEAGTTETTVKKESHDEAPVATTSPQAMMGFHGTETFPLMDLPSSSNEATISEKGSPDVAPVATTSPETMTFPGSDLIHSWTSSKSEL